MFKVAIIGVGQIGSRHLQGLARSNNHIEIFLVEPNSDAVLVAKSRFEEAAKNTNIKSLSWIDSIDELPLVLDMVIIATNSDIRANLIRKLLDSKNVKYLLLEKVLFQKLSDYEEIQKLFDFHNVRVWVNHPRRLFEFYKPFIEKLRNCSQISYCVQGGQWNLCSNGLHYLDHLMYILGDKFPSVEVNTSYLNSEYISTKRGNCVEVGGSLVGTIAGSHFSINCNNSGIANPPMICIFGDTVKLLVDEQKGWAKYALSEDGWVWQEHNLKIAYMQSELTGMISDAILETGSSELPSFAEAAYLHVKFLSAMQLHLEGIDNKVLSFCPIS